MELILSVAGFLAVFFSPSLVW